jgi:hypothetical protein
VTTEPRVSVLLLGPLLNLLRRFKTYVVRVAPHADDLKAIAFSWRS